MPNLFIKKGSILAYRLYDIAHEINLKKAQSLLESQIRQNLRRYKLQKDPLRTITLREAPVIFSLDDENIQIKLRENLINFKLQVEVKIWDYGVLSFRYKIDLPEDIAWKDLVLLGSILDSDSVIDELSVKKRNELTSSLHEALKAPHTHTVFEDYTTYLIEEIEEVTKEKIEGPENKNKQSLNRVKVKDPLDILKKSEIAELLLAEPDRTLADSTKNSIKANYSQYTKKDMLILDWNSALVLDFSKEKEYQDYVDIIEFSLAQLLELRIYDQLLDEKLNDLYNSMENKQHEKVTNFYSTLSEESGSLYLEFSDFFEKIDNSIKTVGDFYLAKVLRSADKKFGFDELKRSMTRKIDSVRMISSMCQEKINNIVDEERNRHSEYSSKMTHKMEVIVIVLILIEVMGTFFEHRAGISKLFNSLF
jgi:hypothetical protein